MKKLSHKQALKPDRAGLRRFGNFINKKITVFR
jgi:hypothetical protein